MRRFAFIAAVVLGASVLAACQSQGVSGPTPQTVIGTVTTPTQTFPIVDAFRLKGNATAGKSVFLGLGGCGGCHKLADAGTTGTFGPDLDTFTPKIDYRAATAQVTNGGTNMPAQTQLSTQQIADVAAYVVKSTGGQAP